ncbi:MAG TPA: hypothetical protein VHB25_11745 [Gemmatimonadaceae bacterium]|nr:hypothetical protein [Gemmatimonadaceae bacterium]
MRTPAPQDRSMHRYDALPELAGLSTYAGATRIGWSVDENVERLLRLHWMERRLMAALVARITAEPVWEVKCALGLHQWQSAERITALRGRIAEMRNPVPPLDGAPYGAESIDALFDEAMRARDTRELVMAVYGVVFPHLADAYRAHHDGCNPLVDHPTARLIRLALPELDDAVQWGRAALAVLGEADAHRDRLQAVLHGAHVDSPDAPPAPPPPPDFHPRRDERFDGQYNFEFAPHVVYNMPEASAEERNLALLCKRTLEMDVPEMMASFMTERTGQPWEFYHDYSRQLWDEMRHAMMGSVALEARGVDWKRDVPLNVSFALRLNLHAEPIERQMMLYAIEQSLMPADTGKRFEHQTAVAAGDALSAHFHDYDWADEVLHAQIGRRALKREGISPDEARERAHAIHEKTWAALDGYRHLSEQRDWWPGFVRETLGIESATVQGARPQLNIFSE